MKEQKIVAQNKQIQIPTLSRTQKYYLKHKEEILARQKNRYTLCKDKINKSKREHHFSIRLEILKYYGGGQLSCVSCGESREPCLSIDHIDNNGNAHRRTIRVNTGSPFYYWLKKNGKPLGYQTLCMNCQFIKRKNAKILKKGF